jgi:hypothetical protein
MRSTIGRGAWALAALMVWAACGGGSGGDGSSGSSGSTGDGSSGATSGGSTGAGQGSNTCNSAEAQLFIKCAESYPASYGFCNALAGGCFKGLAGQVSDGCRICAQSVGLNPSLCSQQGVSGCPCCTN